MFYPTHSDCKDFPAPDEVLGQLLRISLGDWGGEIIYILAVLGLLNIRNIWEREEVSFTRYNEKRAGRSAPPCLASSHKHLEKALK